MKRNLLLFVLTFAAGVVSAQSFMILDSVGNDITATTVVVNGEPNNTTTKSADLVNISATSKTVKVKRRHISMVAGTDNYFCWTQCYAPFTDVSVHAETIAPSDTNTKFHGYYVDNGNTGSSTIMYVFYDVNNPSDTAYFNTTYNITITSLNDPVVSAKIYSSYPNPANSQVTFKYALNSSANAKIVLYNMLGGKVKEINLQQNEEKTSLDLSEIPSGVYFYSLLAEGKSITTKKLVVAH